MRYNLEFDIILSYKTLERDLKQIKMELRLDLNWNINEMQVIEDDLHY